MSVDIGGVSATMITAAGAKFFRSSKKSYYYVFFKIFDNGDVRRCWLGVGDPEPGGEGKIFPIYFLFFSKFSTSAMSGDVGGVSVTPNPVAGAKFF